MWYSRIYVLVFGVCAAAHGVSVLVQIGETWYNDGYTPECQQKLGVGIVSVALGLAAVAYWICRVYTVDVS